MKLLRSFTFGFLFAGGLVGFAACQSQRIKPTAERSLASVREDREEAEAAGDALSDEAYLSGVEAATDEVLAEADADEAKEGGKGGTASDLDRIEPIRPETLRALKEMRDRIRAWAPRCADGTMTLHECPFGDSLEYMGMLCMSGDDEFCGYVKRAQDPTGRFWRSPGLIGIAPRGQQRSFSHDMAHGVFAYLARTKDAETGARWLKYVRGEHNRFCPKGNDGSNGTCKARATYWTMMAVLWDYMGLPRDKKMKEFKFLIEALYDPVQARFQSAAYARVLTAESVITRKYIRAMGGRDRNIKTSAKIGRYLARKDPENPLMRFAGYGPEEYGAQLLLRACPRSLPVVPIEGGWPIYRWSIERPVPAPEYGHSSGWDCVLMANLLLQTPQRGD